MIFLQIKDENDLQNIYQIDQHMILQWKLCMCDSVKLFKYE